MSCTLPAVLPLFEKEARWMASNLRLPRAGRVCEDGCLLISAAQGGYARTWEEVRRTTSAASAFDHSVFDVQRVCMSSAQCDPIHCKIDNA